MIGGHLKIKKVDIEIDEKIIQSVKIGGRTDIFKTDDVKTYLEERDGRVVSIRGVMTFDDQDFYFQCSYDDKFGKVQVKKKGKRNHNLQIVEESFEFLDELFKEYFVDI